MLRVRGLSKSYDGRPVLTGVDLTVEAGEVVALLGPNGAGKTTLVSIVAGLRRADGGTVRVGEVDALANPAAARRLLGLAPQALGIYATLTARQNLQLFGRIAGLGRRELEQRIEEVAAALDLTDLLERRAGLLSGGQQRRLHAAMAMVHRPRLLFLDEPTVGADVVSRRRILELVADLARAGCAVVYATHYLPEVEQLDATVAVLDGGRILATGSVGDLVDQHGTSGLRLVFRGDAPALPEFQVAGATAFLPTPEPGVAAARVLATAESWVRRLEAVEVVRSNLETAYLRLAGQPLTTTTEEALDVVA